MSETKNTAGYRVANTGLSDARWWPTEPLDEGAMDEDRAYDRNRRAAIAFACAERLWQDLSPTRRNMEVDARLYSGWQMLGLSPSLYRAQQTQSLAQLALNVCEAVVDTYVAMLTQDRPKVNFSTSGGDWSLQRKGQQLTSFVDGIFYDQKAYLTAQQCATDSAWAGQGIFKIFADYSRDKPRVGIERVIPIEILVDDQEARYGEPQTLYQVKWLDRLKIVEVYAADDAELREKIMHASTGGFDSPGSERGQEGAELLPVVECWHLGEHAWHMIVVGNTWLVDEAYEREEFPFVWLYGKRPIIGMYAKSIVSSIRGIQREINALLLKVQRHMQLSNGIVFIERGSNVDTAEMTNAVYNFCRYTGTAPTYQAVPPIAEMVIAYIWQLYDRAFQAIGVNQMTAQGAVPPQLKSGKAIDSFADSTMVRFEPNYREYQGCYLELARHVIAVAREISDEYPDFEVKAAGKGVMHVVKWADANLKDEEFVMQMLPSNKLSDDLSSRIEEVQELENAGRIDPADGNRLLDMPDLQQYGAYANASYDITMASVDAIINDGEYWPPEPFIENLAQQIIRVNRAYNKARIDKVPEEKLEMLRQWMQQAQDILDAPPPQMPKANLPPPPPAPAGPAPAPGMGAPGGPPIHVTPPGVS